MSISIDIQHQVDDTDVPSTEQFQRWVNLAYKHRVHDGELCIRIVDSKESAELNHQYRKKNKATNILSFPADLPEGISIPSPPIGDLIVCANVMRREATQQRKELHVHWCHIIIHGCLHLIGYDHINATDAETMEAIEIACLKELGLPNPYGELPAL